MRSFHQKTRLLRLSMLIVGIGIVLMAFATRNYTQLHERLIIQAIGIDWQDGKYQISVHALKTTDEQEVDLFQAQGDTVYEALNRITLQVGKTPLYSQNAGILLGQECARQGLDKIIDFFIRYHESRPTQDVFLAAGTAAEIFELKKDDQYVFTEEVDDLSQVGELNAQMQVKDVVNALIHESDDVYLPMLALQKQQVVQVGTGFFHEGSLRGMLGLDQTRGLLALRESLSGGTQVVEGNGRKATMKYHGSSSKIRTEIEEGEPVFHIAVTCKVGIAEMEDSLEKAMTKEFYSILEEKTSQQLKAQIESAIVWAVKENQCDIFRFGNTLRKQDTAFWKEHRDDWQFEMGQARYEVEVDTSITIEGQELSPKPFDWW